VHGLKLRVYEIGVEIPKLSYSTGACTLTSREEPTSQIVSTLRMIRCQKAILEQLSADLVLWPFPAHVFSGKDV